MTSNAFVVILADTKNLCSVISGLLYVIIKMSYTISNYCPSSLTYRFEQIPDNTTILNFDETHITYGTIFPQIPSHIKEVNINQNIYTDKNRRLITEDMTSKDLRGLIKILFPNTKGVKFYVSDYIINPKPPTKVIDLDDD